MNRGIVIGGLIGLGILSYLLYDNTTNNRVVNTATSTNPNNNPVSETPNNSNVSTSSYNPNTQTISSPSTIVYSTNPNSSSNLPLAQPNSPTFSPSINNYPIPAWEGYSVPHIYQWTGIGIQPLYYIGSQSQFNSVNTLLTSGQYVPSSVAQQYIEG